MEMNEGEIQSRNRQAETIERNLPTDVVMDKVSSGGKDIDPQSKLDLFNFLGLDLKLLNNPDITERILDIVDWVNLQRPEARSEDMLEMLKIIEGRIGRNNDMSLLDHLWNYIRLDIDRIRINKKLRSYENDSAKM